MKNTKKLLISVITVALSLIIMTCCVFTALAEQPTDFDAKVLEAYNSQKYGSFDKGISIEGLSRVYLSYPSVQYGNSSIVGHPNLDFEKGWEYWVDTPSFKMNNETVDGKKNTFVTLTGSENYKGIYTVKFTDSRIKPDDNIAVLYKWRNKSHQNDAEPKVIQLLLGKENANNEEHQLVHYSADGRKDRNIWVADEDDDKEWNIALTNVYHAVKDPGNEYQSTYYFFLCLQSRLNPDIYVGTDFDDVQLVKVNEATGLVYDLDGNQLYNLNSLPTREMPDYIWGELTDKDPNSKIKVDVNDVIAGKIDLNTNPNQSNNSSGIATWIWIVIAVGAVLLIAAATVIVIIKKKKVSAKTEKE